MELPDVIRVDQEQAALRLMTPEQREQWVASAMYSKFFLKDMVKINGKLICYGLDWDETMRVVNEAIDGPDIVKGEPECAG